MQKVVTFYSQGLKIFGNLHLPHEAAPCILTSHGFEGSKEGTKWLVLASSLYDRGFAFLRFNYRGCGLGDERSQGGIEQTQLTGRLADFRAALDFVETTRVDAGRLGVIGSSFGGMVALAVGDPRIKAVAILATPCGGPSMRLRGRRGGGKGLELQSGMRLGDGFYSDIKRYDLCRNIGELGCPILIVHGSRDDVVPVENARELYKNANEPKRLEIIEGADHSFSEPRHLEQAVDLCLDWFERYL